MKKLLTKDFKFTVDNSDDEKGTFTGYASIFGAVDSYGDVVMPGAFKRTLKNKKQFPLLWSHNITEPIGILTGEEDEKGLRIEGQLNLDVGRAVEVRSLMKQGAVDGLSIGYQVVKEGVDKETNARQLKEINLWEVSICVFQACPDAVVDEVKTDEPIIEDPAKATPDIDSNPEQSLHLLKEFRATAQELANLIEGVSK
jgi:HK97 family phage prohead protease